MIYILLCFIECICWLRYWISHIASKTQILSQFTIIPGIKRHAMNTYGGMEKKHNTYSDTSANEWPC